MVGNPADFGAFHAIVEIARVLTSATRGYANERQQLECAGIADVQKVEAPADPMERQRAAA